jgi:hypothetical protein
VRWGIYPNFNIKQKWGIYSPIPIIFYKQIISYKNHPPGVPFY